jgi:predicted DNA-binding protein
VLGEIIMRTTISLPEEQLAELEKVAKEINEKKSGIISKALDLYFDYLDVSLAETRLKEYQSGNGKIIDADQVWKELGI